MVENVIEVFGEEEVGVCGEVGVWKDSGWDSQMVNARELRRGGILMEKKNDEKVECQSGRQYEKEEDRPSVPEEYDRGNERGGETHVIFSNEEMAEQEAFGHILKFPTQWRPIFYHRQLHISVTRMSIWFDASVITLGESLTSSE